MTTQDILELAARVEAATGPDRKLDVLIEWPEVFEPLRITGAVGSQLSVHWNADKFCRSGRIRDYTASLDAAMTLVPEGWRIWNLRQHLTPSGHTRVTLQCWNEISEGKAANDALALTAAALKARAHTKGEE